jgi:hypothetical protein
LSEGQVAVSQHGVEVDMEGNPATTHADGSFNIEKIPAGDVTMTAFDRLP